MKKLTIERIIWRISNDNRMGITISKAGLARMLSKRMGKVVWPAYITRWQQGSINNVYRKELMKVYSELCEESE